MLLKNSSGPFLSAVWVSKRSEGPPEFCKHRTPEHLRLGEISGCYPVQLPVQAVLPGALSSTSDFWRYYSTQCNRITSEGKQRWKKLWNPMMKCKLFQVFPFKNVMVWTSACGNSTFSLFLFSSQLVDFPIYVSEVQKQKRCLGICEEYWHKVWTTSTEKPCSCVYKDMSYYLFLCLWFPHRFAFKVPI